MAGGGVALIGTTLVPLLSGLFYSGLSSTKIRRGSVTSCPSLRKEAIVGKFVRKTD